ncbi:hypothetical protein [Pediococcus ethanolidurans]|uniref:hypothetical protein n=1 Tax=Pediococcus ethanolidurans TaxID=319653 RepID=UPI00345EF5E7
MTKLLDQDQKIRNIVAAQIIKIFYPFVIAKTECGEYLKLDLSINEKKDPLFWEDLTSILKAHLWGPVGRKYHQLLDNGWLVEPQIKLSN